MLSHKICLRGIRFIVYKRFDILIHLPSCIPQANYLHVFSGELNSAKLLNPKCEWAITQKPTQILPSLLLALVILDRGEKEDKGEKEVNRGEGNLSGSSKREEVRNREHYSPEDHIQSILLSFKQKHGLLDMISIKYQILTRFNLFGFKSWDCYSYVHIT